MSKLNYKNWLPWIFVIITFASAYMISEIENFNLGFIILLVVNIGLVFFVFKSSNKAVLTIARTAVGLLFIYSGFVKGVDPLGTQFRIEDYFYAFNMVWAVPFALYLSVLLNAFEFSLGLFLVFNFRLKLVSWLVFFLMIFFAITTLNDALFSPVADCGCFGDALIISNWQTFYKNLVIFSLTLLIFLKRNYFDNKVSIEVQYSLMITIFVLFASFEVFTIQHQPILDFRPWKVGNRLIPKNPQPAKFYFTYKNKKTGELKEYLSSELPWQDTIFMKEWAYMSSREINPDASLYKTFPMMDAEGNDLSGALAASENPVFLMVVYDIKDAKKAALKDFNVIYNLCQKQGWEFYLLNSDVSSDLESVRKKYFLEDYPVLNSDNTALKAAIRANPGLIILRDGVVIDKFNYRDIPDIEELVKIATQ